MGSLKSETKVKKELIIFGVNYFFFKKKQIPLLFISATVLVECRCLVSILVLEKTQWTNLVSDVILKFLTVEKEA